MERPALEIIKDIFISLLIVAAIVIILSIVFYDDISLGRVISEAEEYVLTNEMQKELENSELEDVQEIIVNYYIDASDLKKYEDTKEYDKGKSNPFAAAEISDNSTDNSIDGSNNSSSTNGTDNSSGNFYEDEGIK